jgi:uncharacterized protein (TIGR03067 family)
MEAEIKKLQGTWAMVSLEMEGAPMPGGAVAGAKIVIDGTTFSTRGMGAPHKGTMSIDAAKSPKTLDIAFTEGPERGNTSLAIYEVDGDTWKLCIGLTGRTRPASFATAPGSGHALEILKRETNVAPPDAAGNESARKTPITPEQTTPDAPSGTSNAELDRLVGEWSGVSLVMNGQALPAEYLKGSTRVVKGNETTVTVGGQVMLKATFTVDPARSPKTIDYTLSEGPDKGKRQLGIYALDGDVAKFCFSSPGADRPTELESKAGDGRTFGVWKKARK